LVELLALGVVPFIKKSKVVAQRLLPYAQFHNAGRDLLASIVFQVVLFCVQVVYLLLKQLVLISYYLD